MFRIVCPAAIVGQWVSEVQRILPEFYVVEYYGPKRTKGMLVHFVLLREGFIVTIPDARILARANIVITSYNIVTGEHSASDADTSPSGALFEVKWHRVVLGSSTVHSLASAQ